MIEITKIAQGAKENNLECLRKMLDFNANFHSDVSLKMKKTFGKF